ncbi:MAG: helix-turn-helix domain-containing protein [Pseudomonadaceae bacterium]|nr:helix-turn-helix domain-containing protein [Pseudomonadaceae bacterium]
MTDTPSLAVRLKDILASRKLSAAEVARQSGVSVASLSRILAGKVNPSFESMARLAKTLGVPLDVLADDGTPAPHGHAQTQHVAGIGALFTLDHTDLSPDGAAELLQNAARGHWNHSWTDAYVDATLPLPRAVRATQVGTKRIEVELSFPHTMVEAGSVAGLLSVISASLTGTHARLLDICIPDVLVRTFDGPVFGIRGLRDTTNKHGRPLLAATVRPLHGLSPRQYGRAAFESLAGGIDMTADPTLLHHIPLNPWRERFRFVAEAVHAAGRDTGEFKTHAVNVTAPTVEQMVERCQWAKDLELATVLVDSASIGWSAMQSLSAWCARNDMVLCAMGGRALAGDMMSEQLQAKLLRLLGCDVVSTGSPLRGNVSNRRYVGGVLSALRDDAVSVHPDNGHYFTQTFAGLNTACPAVGGGHNPWHFPRLLDAVGDASIIQCGGSVMGHPWGFGAGATAARVALESVVMARNEGQNINVEGRSILQHAARYSPELKAALEHYQEGSFLFGVVSGPFARAGKPNAGSIIPASTLPTVTPFRKPDNDDNHEE